MKAKYQPGGESCLVQDVPLGETFWFQADGQPSELHQRINVDPFYPVPTTQVSCVRMRDGQLQRINFGHPVEVDPLPDLELLT